MPRKRKDGKQQVNTWVEPELAQQIRDIQRKLKLQHTSDAVKALLQIALENYDRPSNRKNPR